MNKMFTAVSILQLVQSGKIQLTDPLGKYLPDYANKNVAEKVTIHHLLTHTGGTGDIFGPEFDAHREELKTLQDYVKLYEKRDLKFEPGSRWEYSNYGFLLLGVVIEKVSRQSYHDYVREHVFKPTGNGIYRLAARKRTRTRSVHWVYAIQTRRMAAKHRYVTLSRDFRGRGLFHGR
jgi:D-alanyl-D-alanine carboxypeptidase